MLGKTIKDAIVQSLKDGHKTLVRTTDGREFYIDNYADINDERTVLFNSKGLYTVDTKSIVAIIQNDREPMKVLKPKDLK
ncbi:hypothetical protein IM157_01085 [Staphylococcus epidermidis]|nr:hypothetical protein [Staphylococcus epidermidis]